LLIYESYDFHEPFDIAVATDGNVDDSVAWLHLWIQPEDVRTRLCVSWADPLLPTYRTHFASKLYVRVC
jgi:hypothetical protein